MSLLRKTQAKQSQQKQPSNRVTGLVEDSDSVVIDDEVVFGRNQQRLRFGQVVHDPELSDYVLARLAAARELAMAKYREIHG